jgi:hypothetical protein
MINSALLGRSVITNGSYHQTGSEVSHGKPRYTSHILPPGILVMYSRCTCRHVTWIVLGRFLDGGKLEEEIRNRIVASGDIGRPLDEKVVRMPERSGSEDI